MLEVLCNTFGDAATSVYYFGSVPTGYDTKDAICGPRYKFVRLQSTASANDFGYKSGTTSVYCNRCIVAHADYLLTESTFTASVRKYVAPPTDFLFGTSDSAATITKAALIGPYQQDLVRSFDPDSSFSGQNNGFVLRLDSAGTEAPSFSKLYFSEAFDFGKNPDKNAPPQFTILQGADRESYPIKGMVPYQCEREIVLQFTNITRAKLSAFFALPRIFEWPFFLYDSSGDIWDYKLEHVILTDYVYSVKPKQLHDLQLTVRRLVHDDFVIS